VTEQKQQEVAVWLINKVKAEGMLKRSEAVPAIENEFGGAFTTLTAKGNRTLHKKVLQNFRELKDEQISWNVGKQAWFFDENENSETSNQQNEQYIFQLPWAVKAQDVPQNAGLDHPSLYLNRELGWLDFNWRVLHQAMDPRTPLLERVRFIAIASSNLDEFIQKRVGGLKRQMAAGVDDLSPDGRTPNVQIELLQQQTAKMQYEISKVWNQKLRTAIEQEASIKISSYNEINDQQKQTLNDYFDDHIYPTLTPLAVDPGHPFPFISNLSLSLAVKLRRPKRDAFNFARVKIPTNQPRWLSIESEAYAFHYVSIEEVIRQNIHKLFPGMQVESTCLFRITRNADIRRNEEEAEDLLSLISEELRERRFAEVVRLEIEEEVDSEVLNLLKNELRLNEEDIIHVHGLLNLTSCFSIANKNIPRLRYDKWNPVIPKPLYHEGETEEEEPVEVLVDD